MCAFPAVWLAGSLQLLASAVLQGHEGRAPIVVGAAQPEVEAEEGIDTLGVIECDVAFKPAAVKLKPQALASGLGVPLCAPAAIARRLPSARLGRLGGQRQLLASHPKITTASPARTRKQIKQAAYTVFRQSVALPSC